MERQGISRETGKKLGPDSAWSGDFYRFQRPDNPGDSLGVFCHARISLISGQLFLPGGE